MMIAMLRPFRKDTAAQTSEANRAEQSECAVSVRGCKLLRLRVRTQREARFLGGQF
jgi:hypothetical protein